MARIPIYFKEHVVRALKFYLITLQRKNTTQLQTEHLRVFKQHIKILKELQARVLEFLQFIKYLDPIVAWGFTKLREKEEGRKITKEVFIDSLFKAKENVNRIKKIFGNKIEIWLVESVFHPNKTKNIIARSTKFNIDNIDNHLKIKYNSKDLDKILKV